MAICLTAFLRLDFSHDNNVVGVLIFFHLKKKFNVYQMSDLFQKSIEAARYWYALQLKNK